jgi:hypothetical protein
MRKVTAALATLVLAWPIVSSAQDESRSPWRGWCEYKEFPGEHFPPPRLNLPAWVCDAAFDARLHTRYSVYSKINPFYLSGDFNGDGRLDVVVLVTEKRSRKLGIVIMHRGAKRPIVIGAGRAWDDRGDDLRGIDMWTLLPKGEVMDGGDEEHRKVKLRGDAIVLERSESAAFAVYWDGGKYLPYQLSD